MIGISEQDGFTPRHTFTITATLVKDVSPADRGVFTIPTDDSLTFSGIEYRIKDRRAQSDPQTTLTLTGEPLLTTTSLFKATPPCNAPV